MQEPHSGHIVIRNSCSSSISICVISSRSELGVVITPRFVVDVRVIVPVVAIVVVVVVVGVIHQGLD